MLTPCCQQPPCMMASMNKPITWFEIPALELGRARAFYEQLLGLELRQEAMGPSQLAVFPYDREQAVGGCLIQGAGFKPGSDGAVVYLNVQKDLQAALNRAIAAGGQVVVPLTALPPGMGFFAHILDPEGNRVGLHAAA